MERKGNEMIQETFIYKGEMIAIRISQGDLLKDFTEEIKAVNLHMDGSGPFVFPQFHDFSVIKGDVLIRKVENSK